MIRHPKDHKTYGIIDGDDSSSSGCPPGYTVTFPGTRCTGTGQVIKVCPPGGSGSDSFNSKYGACTGTQVWVDKFDGKVRPDCYKGYQWISIDFFSYQCFGPMVPKIICPEGFTNTDPQDKSCTGPRKY